MKLSVLLAEDSTLNQRLMRKVLHTWGYDLDIAINGQEAIDKLKAGKYDVILMDIQMPKMDGNAATQIIRNLEDPAINSIPIIALTAHASQDEADKCLSIGMNAYISKPFEPEFLKNTMMQLTSKSRLKENTELKTVETESVQLYDLTYLRDHADGDHEFFQEMIGIFLTDTPPLLAELRSDIQEKDFKKIKTTSHSMKGLFLTLGIKHAANLIKEIEAMAQQEISMDRIKSNFENIESFFNKCISPLQEELKKIKSS